MNKKQPAKYVTPFFRLWRGLALPAGQARSGQCNFFCILLLTALGLASCDKSLELDSDPELTVTTGKKTYKIGEEVEFKFTGNPNMISFYSGEVGNDYDFREGRIVPPGELTATLSTNVQYGAQSDQLSILVSTDYNGSKKIEDIKAATWTDITERFTLGTGVNYVNGGEVNVSDLVAADKPMYFCLRYIFDPAKGAARTWGIRDFKVNKNTVIGNITTTMQTAGFGLYYFGPKETKGRSSVGASTIFLMANSLDNRADYTEDWCVSSALDVGSKDMGPDRPLAVKGYSDAPLHSYAFVYNKPGTYKACFIATDATIKEARTVVKEVEVEIVP